MPWLWVRETGDAMTTHPVRVLRVSRGLSQEALAGLSGLSPALVCRIENGQRDLSRRTTIIALAKALEVRPIELIPWALTEPRKRA